MRSTDAFIKRPNKFPDSLPTTGSYDFTQLNVSAKPVYDADMGVSLLEVVPIFLWYAALRKQLFYQLLNGHSLHSRASFQRRLTAGISRTPKRSEGRRLKRLLGRFLAYSIYCPLFF